MRLRPPHPYGQRVWGTRLMEELGVLIPCERSGRSSRAPEPHPSGCCASSQDHPLLPATMNSWTSSAFLQSTMLQLGLHKPCCLLTTNSGRARILLNNPSSQRPRNAPRGQPFFRAVGLVRYRRFIASSHRATGLTPAEEPPLVAMSAASPYRFATSNPRVARTDTTTTSRTPMNTGA